MKKIQYNFNITITFANGSKMSYEEFMEKPREIDVSIEENRKVVENYLMLLSPEKDKRTLARNRRLELDKKKEELIKQYKILEMQSDELKQIERQQE